MNDYEKLLSKYNELEKNFDELYERYNNLINENISLRKFLGGVKNE